MYNYTTTFKGNLYKHEKLCFTDGEEVDEEIDVFYTIISNPQIASSFSANIIHEGEIIIKRFYNEELDE